MSVPSQESASGIGVNFYQSPIQGGGFIDRYHDVINYTHTIQAFGGFDTCSFGVVESLSDLEDWFENGLGRIVRVFSETGSPMWEGFVDRVILSEGGLEVSRGPLLDIGNKVNVWYSSFDFGATPPIPGIRKETVAGDALESQAKYGIVYKIMSAAGVSDTNAVQLRNTYLIENSLPIVTSTYSFSNIPYSLQIECRGFAHWLTYPYNKLTAGFTTLSAKIIDLLGADPNSLISTDYSHIQTNTYILPFWEIDEQPAIGILKGLIALGDASENRYLFGIYEDRVAYYNVVPSSVEFFMRLGDPNRNVIDTHGSVIEPWQMRPGKWVCFTNFMPGFTPEGLTLREDPRNMFIESVEFTAPNQLALVGGKTTKLEQKLARYGLAGISS